MAKRQQVAQETPPAPVRWEVIDTQTGQVLGNYGSMRRALNNADKRDNDYGAVRHRVRQVSGG